MLASEMVIFPKQRPEWQFYPRTGPNDLGMGGRVWPGRPRMYSYTYGALSSYP